MSQEILFLIFLALEAVMLVTIYQVFLLKMIRKAVVDHWLSDRFTIRPGELRRVAPGAF